MPLEVKTAEYKPPLVKLMIALNFLKEEWGAEDPWYYPSCQEATKKLDLWSQHPVLTIFQGIFFYSRYLRHKLDTLVDFHINDWVTLEFLIQMQVL